MSADPRPLQPTGAGEQGFRLNVSAWSIRNPTPALLIFVLLTVAGLFGFRAMVVQHFPDVELPTVLITAALPGAGPEQVETEVARRIENSVATLSGIKHIHTRAQDGAATIAVEFRLEKPVAEAMEDVRSAIARVRRDLPVEMQEPVVMRMDIAATPILAFTVASDRMDEEALSWFVDDAVSRALASVAGVGGVTRVGGATREIAVELHPARLSALGLTAADVSRLLRRVQQQAAGGRLELGGGEQAVRTLATVNSAAALAELSLPLSDGRGVRLDRIATIRDTVQERRAIALLDGKPVVAFEVTRSRGAGEVAVSSEVRAKLQALQQAHPGLTLTEAFNFVDPVQENYSASMRLLFEGALLAIVVVWLFLRDVRATFLAAVALPMSIIPAFAGMYLMGFTLNMVTLLALSLVVGVLVDDAIVEIENIMRHLRMGKPPYQAAMEAADEIGLAVIATTFTLIAVFLPTAFMSGVPGRFFVQFGWTAAIAVFASLVVARMLTPMMAAYMLRAVPAHADGWVMRGYMRTMRWCLRHRGATILGAVAFFVGGLALAPLLPTGFLPPDDGSQTQVRLELAPGVRFEQTLKAAEQARALLQQVPYIEGIYTTVGGGSAGRDPFAPGGVSEVRRASLTIRLAPRGQRSLSKRDIETRMRQALAPLPGARVQIGIGGSGDKYVLVLAGDDGDLLLAHAQTVARELRTIEGIGNIGSTASLQRPELVVRPDSARAAELGVTAAAIAETMRVATIGDYDQSLPRLNLPARQIPIMVRLPASERDDLERIGRLQVPGAHRPVLLSSVASLSLEGAPVQISRYDRLRNVNFEIEPDQLSLGQLEAAILALPSIQNLPAGVIRTTVGDAEAMAELGQSFGLAMLTGVLCIWMVLVLLFRDFSQPITILMALVLSVPGAILALYVTGLSLSMPSMIGLIMLMGIATKNSILLVEYAIMARRDRGMSRFDALVDACHKRARPIVMTTLAMGAGMLPAALGIGMDPSFRAPMAWVVIGGLITSTFLSLLVIPVVFTLIDDVAAALIKLLRGREPIRAS